MTTKSENKFLTELESPSFFFSFFFGGSRCPWKLLYHQSGRCVCKRPSLDLVVETTALV